MGTCTTGFGSPSQLQDRKAPMLSGMETRCAAKLLTQQEHGTSPWHGLSSPRGAECSFPSSVQPWECQAPWRAQQAQEHTGGIALSGMKCAPPASFSHRAEGHSNFCLPIKGWFRCPKDTRRHLTTPVLQNRQQSREPSVVSLSPTQLCSCHQKRGQKRAVQHILSLLPYLLF